MDTSGRALVSHWTWAADKGDMNKNSAGALRAACAQVLSVVDGWENVDVKTLDIETTLVRFQNLKHRDLKPEVLETYKRRFKQAVASYLCYVEDPGGWKAGVQDRSSTRAKVRVADRTQDAVRPPRTDARSAGASLVEYPFPLREGCIARLSLPQDLKLSEAKRLMSFVAAIAIDFEPAGVV